MMTVKQAKEHCGYQEKPTLPTCGNCGGFASEKQLPAWMIQANAERLNRMPYTVEAQGVEKNMRCLDHGFATRKTAGCRLFRHREGS